MPSSIQISVIIPTHNRPELVKRAIASVYAQDLENASTIVETIVVINGADNITRSALTELNYPNLNDHNLKVIQIPEAGGSNARNIGVQNAQGHWIAFLDDDDEWLPQKLRLQYAAALACVESGRATHPLIASKLIARTPKGDFERPRRFPNQDEDLSDYLLGRTGFFQGEGVIQTSVIFTTRQLLLKTPFLVTPKHEDWNWILIADKRSDVVIEFIPEVLAIWYLEERRSSVSSKHSYQKSLDWITKNRILVTPSAYAAFILVEVGSQAAHQQEWSMFPKLLKLAFTQGKPNAIVLLLYLSMWLLPLELRRTIRARLTRKPSSQESPKQALA